MDRVASFRSILCPVDFSDHSIRALRYGVGLAGRERAHLTVLSVSEPLLVEAARAAGYDRQYIAQETRKELRGSLSSVVPSGASWARVPHVVLRTGRPETEILSCARELNADLIVMGTHGLGGYRKMFFGSVTERVLRAARIPVLAVPLTDRELVVLSDRQPIFNVGRVMAPVDLSAASEAQARTAAALARRFGASLLLAHVVTEVRTYPALREPVKAREQELVDEARRRLESLASELRNGLVVDTYVGFGRPADEIAAMAAEQDVGVIVMGLTGKGATNGRPGSVAYRVLCLGPAPVLALPPV